jgi:hypothetical protein
MKGDNMGEWISIAQWHECERMARAGIVFEIRNAEGRSLFSPCVVPLPPMPFDWKQPPVRFRAISEQKPEHSAPLPRPKG